MKVHKVKGSEFIKDYEHMLLDDLKEKYGLNNRSIYKVIDGLGLERRRTVSEQKKIVII